MPITRDSFDETKRYGKVRFQEGRVVPDFELNELQDNIRVAQARSGMARMDGVAEPTALQPIGNGSPNDILIEGGTLFYNGQTYTLDAGTRALTSLGVTPTTNSSGAHVYRYVYIQLQEIEVGAGVDPNIAVPALGETAVRNQLSVTWVYGSSIPASDSDPVALGGVHRVPICRILRRNGVAEIEADDILDLRPVRLPDAAERIANVSVGLTASAKLTFNSSTHSVAIQNPLSTTDLGEGLLLQFPNCAGAIVSGSWTVNAGQSLVYRPKLFASQVALRVPGLGTAPVGVADGGDDSQITVVDTVDIATDGSLFVICSRLDSSTLLLNNGRRIQVSATTGRISSWQGEDVEAVSIFVSPHDAVADPAYFSWAFNDRLRCTDPARTAYYDLNKHLKDGVMLTQVEMLIDEGSANACGLAVLRWAMAAAFTTPAAPTSASLGSDPSAGASAAEVMSVAALTEVVDKTLYRYEARFTSSAGAGGGTPDDVFGLRLRYVRNGE